MTVKDPAWKCQQVGEESNLGRNSSTSTENGGYSIEEASLEASPDEKCHSKEPHELKAERKEGDGSREGVAMVGNNVVAAEVDQNMQAGSPHGCH